MSKVSNLILGLFLIYAVPVSAEVISIADPRYNVPNDNTGVVRPTRGMSMKAVTDYYGHQPVKQLLSVNRQSLNGLTLTLSFSSNTAQSSMPSYQDKQVRSQAAA